MLPILKGPVPLAVVLCRFNDVPVLDIPRSRFFDFVSQYGRGGLFDFWRDVSYGTIDLTGSEVFGWYTMKYSFVHDGLDPLKNGRQGRFAWISEAIRLAAENGVDLSRFYAVIAVVNANVDDSNAGRNTAMGIGGSWGQTNWRWCQKCQGLGYAGFSSGVCPSGGAHDFTASSNYALSIDDAAFPGQDNWRWCDKCQGLAYAGNAMPGQCPAGGVHDGSRSADYRLGAGKVGYPGQNLWKWCKKCQGLGYSGNPSPGACPAGGTHDYSASADYTLVAVSSGLNATFNAHETGHCYGLAHSWSANPDIEYGDPWDIMSAMRVRAYDNKYYPPAGPGLNAPTLYKLGWLTDDRVYTFRAPPGSPGPIVPGARVKLASLNRPELDGYLMARILTPNHVYTVEFRQATGWDSGIGRDGVLIHELRSNYTTGQNNWRWCDKCQGLVYAGSAVCPAGGVHDHSQSFNYRLALGDPGFGGQHGWRWCRKCQGLAFLDGAPGPCPAGGVHNHSDSGDYGLAINKLGFPGQNLWKWCNKCQGLAYAGSATPGACPAGGAHDHSGSGDYSLAHDTAGSGQDQWRWCSKCQGLAYDGYGACQAGGSHHHGGSGDYSLEANDPTFPGQDKWQWCRKCYGLAFAGGPTGRCPAGGDHDHAGSGNYSLLRGVGDNDGQNQWRWCKKCQLLAYGGNPPGPCPAGGTHDYSSSADYTLANFGQDRTFLIQSDWQQGQVFLDDPRNVRIAVDQIDSASSTAAITIGHPIFLSPGRPLPAIPGSVENELTPPYQLHLKAKHRNSREAKL
jgi:Gametolysin peptidase M11